MATKKATTSSSNTRRKPRLVIDEERRLIVWEASCELDGLLDLMKGCDDERALRGLAIRAASLNTVILSAIDDERDDPRRLRGVIEGTHTAIAA